MCSTAKLHDLCKEKQMKHREFPKNVTFMRPDSFHHKIASIQNIFLSPFLLAHTKKNLLVLSLASFNQIKFSGANKCGMTMTTAKAVAKMKCKYWKQLHGTMGLLKAHCNVLFAFVMVVVCHYLWCDSICLADWIKRMNTKQQRNTHTQKIMKEIACLNYKCCAWG